MAAFSDVDLVDIFQAVLRGERMDIHVALPGIVKAYYPATQLADIIPALKVPQFAENGMRIQGGGIALPVLPMVPVIWPRAGGHMFVMPLTAGDFVWVQFSEGGTGEYRLSGQVSEPFDVSRHSITYPVCTPGAYPDTKALPDASAAATGTSVWGKSGGVQIQNNGTTINFCTSGSTTAPADAPALASVVDSILAAFTAWTPVSMDGGAALKTAIAAHVMAMTSKSAIIKCT